MIESVGLFLWPLTLASANLFLFEFVDWGMKFWYGVLSQFVSSWFLYSSIFYSVYSLNTSIEQETISILLHCQFDY